VQDRGHLGVAPVRLEVARQGIRLQDAGRKDGEVQDPDHELGDVALRGGPHPPRQPPHDVEAMIDREVDEPNVLHKRQDPFLEPADVAL
jgi:hypothetical protein